MAIASRWTFAPVGSRPHLEQATRGVSWTSFHNEEDERMILTQWLRIAEYPNRIYWLAICELEMRSSLRWTAIWSTQHRMEDGQPRRLLLHFCTPETEYHISWPNFKGLPGSIYDVLLGYWRQSDLQLTLILLCSFWLLHLVAYYHVIFDKRLIQQRQYSQHSPLKRKTWDFLCLEKAARAFPFCFTPRIPSFSKYRCGVASISMDSPSTESMTERSFEYLSERHPRDQPRPI